MDADKAERFGVSMPGRLVAAIDSVADEAFGGNRSAYLESLAEADLEVRGKLPGSPAEQALSEARATIELLGAEAARQEFRAVRERKAQEVVT